MALAVQTEAERVSAHHYQLVLMALNGLPNHCVLDVDELARRIGADKLELITWARANLEFARLMASKVAT